MMRTLLGALFISAQVASPPALAHLGGDAASVAADALRLRGAVQTTARLQYDLHEIHGTDGVTVREFATPAGVVFAVSWSGPVQPDLRSLLGASFDAYTRQLAGLPHPGLQRAIHVALPELILQSGGHLRAYSGRAYLPGLMPAGVKESELQ